MAMLRSSKAVSPGRLAPPLHFRISWGLAVRAVWCLLEVALPPMALTVS